jgi:predicted amidophosphoribosyltransferase
MTVDTVRWMDPDFCFECGIKLTEKGMLCSRCGQKITSLSEAAYAVSEKITELITHPSKTETITVRVQVSSTEMEKATTKDDGRIKGFLLGLEKEK